MPFAIDKVILPIWKSTRNDIIWVSALVDKAKYNFLQFDIMNYYSSISPTLLNKDLNFARKFVNILSSDIDVILAAREALISSDERT